MISYYVHVIIGIHEMAWRSIRKKEINLLRKNFQDKIMYNFRSCHYFAFHEQKYLYLVVFIAIAGVQ